MIFLPYESFEELHSFLSQFCGGRSLFAYGGALSRFVLRYISNVYLLILIQQDMDVAQQLFQIHTASIFLL